MKVIIIGPAYPFRGGIADTNESLCRAFTKQGHEASIVTFTVQYPSMLFPGKTQYSTDPPPTDLRIVRKINSVNPLSWIAAAQYVNKLSPDLVVVRYWLPFLGAGLGTIARRIGKATKVIALCDNILPHEKRLGDDTLTRYFINSFDGFITMSGTVQHELTSYTDKPQICMPHPINDNLGERQPRSLACERLGLDAQKRYLLFFGLVRKYKGLDLLLQAMARPEIEALDLTLIVAGEWYDDKQEYQELLSASGVKDRVVIRDEFVPAAAIQDYFSAADLVTQTYHTASQSGVTQIAFHFEKPILVTNVGGLSEVVHHGRLGYVAEKNAADIASCITAHFSNTDVAKMEEAIRAEKVKYSWTSFADKVVDFASSLD